MPIEFKTENTAIRRNKPSMPTKHLMEKTLHVPDNATVLDFGCGRGDDIEYLVKECGCEVSGYDPNFAPYDSKPKYAERFDAVICNYVLCVIPSRPDRHGILEEAWHHVDEGGIMMVSVRSKQAIEDARNESWTAHNDGWITSMSRKTFQHGYTEDELIKHIYRLEDVGGFELVCNRDNLIAIVMKTQG